MKRLLNTVHCILHTAPARVKVESEFAQEQTPHGL